MLEARDYLALADWRRRVARLYAEVRAAPVAGRVIAWNEWRAARNELFRSHSQSPLSAGQRASFRALDYYPYDPGWRLEASVERDAAGERLQYNLGQDGDFVMRRIGWANFIAGDHEGRLALYWIEGYGGGLFLPFKDATNQLPTVEEGGTYPGGRYLFDTIKGADLGLADGRIVLDFNYAYNPSCAYHSRWLCPLTPQDNWLSLPVTAGEKRFAAAE